MRVRRRTMRRGTASSNGSPVQEKKAIPLRSRSSRPTVAADNAVNFPRISVQEPEEPTMSQLLRSEVMNSPEPLSSNPSLVGHSPARVYKRSQPTPPPSPGAFIGDEAKARPILDLKAKPKSANGGETKTP